MFWWLFKHFRHWGELIAKILATVISRAVQSILIKIAYCFFRGNSEEDHQYLLYLITYF